MPIIEIDKDADSIIITTDGVDSLQTVRRVDTVVSVPPEDYKKIFNIYYNPVTGGIVFSVEA